MVTDCEVFCVFTKKDHDFASRLQFYLKWRFIVALMQSIDIRCIKFLRNKFNANSNIEIEIVMEECYLEER